MNVCIHCIQFLIILRGSILSAINSSTVAKSLDPLNCLWELLIIQIGKKRERERESRRRREISRVLRCQVTVCSVWLNETEVNLNGFKVRRFVFFLGNKQKLTTDPGNMKIKSIGT